MNKFFIALYEKLIKINDSPQRIALGFGLGVFLGILPGAGPLVSLGLAILFRVNRIAAVAGSLLTNTWLSVITFVLACKLGSALLGRSWQDIYDQCKELLKHFHWKELFDARIVELLKPLFLGYLIIGIVAAVVAYIIVLLFLWEKRKLDARRHP